jgi:sulfate/thiosulfate transport system ATP-binding protein
MTLQIKDLSRRYGGDAALEGIDLDIAEGEFLALLGPSGAGKTTLLRLIAGLDRPNAGSILIDGHDVLRLSPRDRGIGFVFQNYALFRHMNVARNIAFGLSVKPRRERPSRAEIASRVEELLGLMQLSGLGDRFPAKLSGGQRQRVALARALAVGPRVLLLDEPFGALDAKVRGELRDWLKGLQRQLGVTTIFVTHDQNEAFQLADRVAILNAGRLEQIGSPDDLHFRPATPFVRTFLGAADRSGQVHPSRESDSSAFAAAGHDQCACRAAARQTASVTSEPRGREPGCGDRPSWTPRIVDVLPDALPSADLPSVAAGELWLIALPAGNSEPTPLERDALTHANVIIFDRALTDIVADVMPLGGYAEPTDGDGLARSLQFARDGWSVIRLIASPDDRDGEFPAAQKLRDAGALGDWRIRRLLQQHGRWICDDDARLGNANFLSTKPPAGFREAIVVSAAVTAAPALCAVMSNGLAG